LQQVAITDSKEALKNQIKKTLKALARDQASIINIQFKRIEHEMSIIESMLRVNNFAVLEEEKALKEKLILLIKFNPNLNLIYFSHGNGVIIRSKKTDVPSSFNACEREWFKTAKAEGKRVWVGPYKSASTKKMIMTCATPLYDKENHFLGVLGVDINIRAIIEKFMTTQVQKDTPVFLLEADGDVIIEKNIEDSTIHWSDKLKKINIFKQNKYLLKFKTSFAKNKEGIFSTFSTYGYPIVVAYATISTTNWRFAIQGKQSIIIKPALATEEKINKASVVVKNKMENLFSTGRLIFLGIILMLIFFALFLGFWISKHFTAPLIKLREGVLVIGAGNLNHKIEIKTGDEIEELGNTFNEMTSDLKEYIKNLNQTIIAKERIEQDLKHAHDIQASMVPNKFPAFPGYPQFELFARMLPAKAVGGDFYDYLLLDEEHLFFCIGDVSGKGVPAALFMAITKTLTREEALRGHAPDKILENVNNTLEGDNDSCMFATLFCGILNITTGALCYSNGGHNPPVLLKNKTQKGEYLNINRGFVVGPMPTKPEQYKLEKLTLEKGDTLCLYTDGVTEAMNEENKQFSEKSLLEGLNKCYPASPTVIINDTFDAVFKFTQTAPQSDDITMLTIKYIGNS
jgi:sigma-B regulation protein RsbU (phosphoserine phosphatase)